MSGEIGSRLTILVQLVLVAAGLIGSLLQRMGLVLRCISVEEETGRRNLISAFPGVLVVRGFQGLWEKWRRMETIVESLEMRNLLLRLSLDCGEQLVGLGEQGGQVLLWSSSHPPLSMVSSQTFRNLLPSVALNPLH